MQIQTTAQPKGRERVLTYTKSGRPFNVTLRIFDRLLHNNKIEWREDAWREVV